MLILLAVAVLAPPPTDRGEALREAARRGEVVRARELLDAGVAVDAAARYGQTALYFAAEKGDLAVVRLLVERGADVNARDRFFGSSPLGMALGGKHVAIALLLLERGAVDAGEALGAAVESGDVALARAALASRHLEPLDLAAARRDAEKKGGEMQALLAAASVARPERKAFSPNAQRLRAYAVRYRTGDGRDVRVTVEGESVRVVGAGLDDVTLRPIGEDRFESADGKVALGFGGRAGLVEFAALNREGDITRFSVVVADPQPLRAGTAPAAAAPRQAARPWPQFRGERARGDGDGQGVPAAWHMARGENVRFKTPIPGLGLSSPIVWGDRIFVTTAVSSSGDQTFRTGLYGDGTSVDDLSEHSFRLYALDKATGGIVWQSEVHRGVPPVRRHLKSSLANATPATDGKRVVVFFGPIGVLAAYDFSGRPLWRREVGVLDVNDPQSGTAEWGHASSPILYRDLVILQGDRRKESFLAAYRLSTGQEAWKVSRAEGSTWATPNVLSSPSGDELLTNGQRIRAYDPASGRELWTLGPNSEVVVATPVVGEGTAYITAGYPPIRPIYAVRAGQRGDLSLPDGARSSTAIPWSHERGGTYIPTPLLYRGHFYTVNNNGILTCYRADTGEQVYQTRLGQAGASFAASPVAADGRLYFASETGEVYVLRAGPEYSLLGTHTMEEVIMATPAIADGLMVVRTLGHVVGLAEGKR